jgi:hypothetical protein
VKSISTSAKRFIIATLSDYRISAMLIADIPEEIRAGIDSFIQSDEEMQTVENIQQILSVLRDSSLSNVSGILQPSNSFGFSGIGSDLTRFGKHVTLRRLWKSLMLSVP